MNLYGGVNMNKSVQDRAMGALMGAFIGEALGVGPHWFYNLDELQKEFGTWINDYTDPLPGRYHDGVKAGELSQAGLILRMMAENLVDNEGYSESAFCKMMDEQLFPQLDGTPMAGPGGYTSQATRHIWSQRVTHNKPWNEVAGIADTTESIERNIAVAVYYAKDLSAVSKIIAANTALTQSDNITGSLSVAFCVVLAFLIQGEPLDGKISEKLMQRVFSKELPFHSVVSKGMNAPKKGKEAPTNEGMFASPDALLSPGYMAQAALDPDIKIEPAWKVSLVYGMPCAIYHMLPASYYLGARFKNDFEGGVLNALNGGGQNQIRTMLTGALIGAQVGLSGIPERFIKGLIDSDALLDLCKKVTMHL